MRRHFAVKPATAQPAPPVADDSTINAGHVSREVNTVLEVQYSATTPRMLRVAVNGFFESLGVVLGVMEELDEDVIGLPGKDSVSGAQGVVALDGE